jgi:hypothetical protein
MTVVVAVIVIAALASLCIGLITALASLRGTRSRVSRIPMTISAEPIYRSFTTWTIVLGIFLMLAPDNWFGPSWSYFSQMEPHNGTGMGLCFIVLGSLQGVVLRRHADARVLSILFFLNGFVCWTAGIILGAEGLFGHQGLMEAPFMLYVGVHAFALSAAVRVHAK